MSSLDMASSGNNYDNGNNRSGGSSSSGREVREGPVKCAAWIRWTTTDDDDYNPLYQSQGKATTDILQTSNTKKKKREVLLLVVNGRWKSSSCPPLLEIFSFDPNNTCSLSPSPLVTCEIDGNPLCFAVHPTGDELVCATTAGCRLFELHSQESTLELQEKDFNALKGTTRQKCLSFSTDGSRFASGGEDGRLRIFEWPSQRLILDEPKAHKSFRDMDISLDSQFLVTTSIDGGARIWKINDGVPLTSLTRSSVEKIECCRFSRDGSKPFLFCTIQKGTKMVIGVWEIANWSNIGYKRLLKKQASVLSVSLDGKYLALGSNDGDVCIVEVKKMEISHWSKKLHLGTSVTSIDFCPTERVVVSTSSQWGAIVTKLNVPADWKEWQIYLLLLGLFLASLVVFMILYEHSDSFWNFPLGSNQPANPFKLLKSEPQIADDQSIISE